MIPGHVLGLPIEETVLQFAPAGAATLAVVTFVGRAKLARLVGHLRRRDFA
jgi:hypothetical protein